MRKEVTIEVGSENQVKPIIDILRKTFPNRYPNTREGVMTLYADLQVISKSLKEYLFLNGCVIKDINIS